MIKFASCAFFLALAGCGDSSMNEEHYLIKSDLNGTIENMLKSSTAPFNKDCNLGLCFYDFDISARSPSKAIVTLISSSNSLVFKDVISALFITRTGSPITDINLILGGVPENSRHIEAADYFFRTLDDLRIAGWRRYIFPGEARIPGNEAERFDHYDEILNVPVSTGPWKDPTLRLNEAQWDSITTISSWYLFKDGNYLEVRVQRENSDKEPSKRGNYLISLNFQTEAEFFKSFLESDDREQWTTLLPAELKRMAQERAHTEARLKKMGIAIDEDYQDPPIKALQ